MSVNEVRQAIEYCRSKQAFLTGGQADGDT